MRQLLVNPIGTVRINEEGVFIELDAKYAPALKELDGFSHLNVIWWFSDFDNEQSREVLEASSPYRNGPPSMGVFATRSPVRPNPVALSSASILWVDAKKARIAVAYIDAHDGSPVIDLKPYTPSLDRVEKPRVPDWCSHWPKSLEASGEFDWENEFNF
jgi:tRNA-Thr(GGU) m(6)t(6)A37 methyltransferase TsaA